MPTEPAQQVLVAFELLLMALGLVTVARVLFTPGGRQRWLHTHRLPPWPLTPPEFMLFLSLVFMTGFGIQAAAHLVFGNTIAGAADSEGLQVFIYGTAFHAGGILVWLVFPAIRRALFASYGVAPAPIPPSPTLAFGPVLHTAATAVAASLPILVALSLGWGYLLRRLGLPDEQQDLIAVFAGVRSPTVIVGMLTVACVLAPMNEELIFRAGLYRFCRQRLGRSRALVISGVCFGALHLNLASFLPLALLGMGLALVYEATGSIRIAMVAHGLFNLNTVLVVLSGLKA